MLCIFLLAAMSIPRRIEVAADSLIIYGVLEVSIIRYNDIKVVETIDRIPYYMIPVVGILGFGGYYGYWINVKDLSLCKVYASRHRACLRIRRYNDIDIIINDFTAISPSSPQQRHGSSPDDTSCDAKFDIFKHGLRR